MLEFDIDASSILSYLNKLGFRNITAKLLKQFMEDLQKLIKYEQSLTDEVEYIPDMHYKFIDFIENLHRAPQTEKYSHIYAMENILIKKRRLKEKHRDFIDMCKFLSEIPKK